MSDDTIEHSSAEKQVFGVNEQVVERKTKKGIAWTCKCFTENSSKSDTEESVYLGWKFEWSNKAVIGYHGEVVVCCDLGEDLRLKFPVKVMKSGEWVERRLAKYSECSVDGYRIFQYSFRLSPIRKLAEKRVVKPSMWGSSKKSDKSSDKPVFGSLYKSCSNLAGNSSSDKSKEKNWAGSAQDLSKCSESSAEIVLPTDGFGSGFMKTRKEKNKVDENQNPVSSPMNDTVLLVAGKKVHVNKTFLAIHSEFFHQLLFSDDSKSMTEIPIDDVSAEEFERLLAVISPDPVFPDDDCAELLLELADRFAMPAVTRHVENFLIFASKIGKCEDSKSAEILLKLADLFNLPSLQSLVENRLFKNANLCESIVIAQNYGLDTVLKSLIGTISNKEHLKSIRESEKYRELRDATKLAIYEQYNRDI